MAAQSGSFAPVASAQERLYDKILNPHTQKYDDADTQVLPASQETLHDGIMNPDTQKYDDADTQMHPSLMERLSDLMSDSEGAGSPGIFFEPMTVLPGLEANFVMHIGDGDVDSDAEDERVEPSKHSFVYGQGSQTNGMNANVENGQDHSEVADIGARFKVIDGNVKNVIAIMEKKGKKRGRSQVE